MKSYLRIVATINLLAVISLLAGARWAVVVATFTAITMFIDGITNHSKSGLYTLFLVGSIWNFIGVVSGSVSNSPAILGMASFGSVLLFSAHWGERNKPKNI